MTDDEDDLYYHSELETAIVQGDAERFQELIEDADLDHRSDNGSTLLHKAAISGRPDMAVELVDRGVDIDARKDGGETPLHLAVRSEQWDVARTLVIAGADPNLQNASGTVPLLKVVFKDQLELAELLLKHGADPEIENDGGLSPLDIAKQAGKDDVIDVLTQR